MTRIHTPDLKPLTEGDAILSPLLCKMDKDADTDPAYDNPCKGVMIGVLASSVFWAFVYVLVLYFRGMG